MALSSDMGHCNEYIQFVMFLMLELDPGGGGIEMDEGEGEEMQA